MKDNQKIWVGLLALFLIVGVISVFVFSGEVGEKDSFTTPVVVETRSSEVIETEEPKTGPVASVEETQEPTQGVVMETILPTPRSGLESTDPSVVNLGSGEIQLVEFFAYW